MKRYIVDIISQFKILKWWERVIIILFLIRLISYFVIPDTILPQYESYTYNSAIWHILTAAIELNAVYMIYRRLKDSNISADIGLILCYIATGHVIDKFTEAAIKVKISELVWVIVVVVYVFTVWKQRTHGQSTHKK